MASLLLNRQRRRPGTPPQRRAGNLARFALVAAWLVFWLNTALFPCCEAAAALLGGHTESPALMQPGESSSHVVAHSDSDSSGTAPEPACNETDASVRASVGEYELFTAGRYAPEQIAADTLSAFGVAPVFALANLARARASPPPAPPLPRYLLTQRLLI